MTDYAPGRYRWYCGSAIITPTTGMFDEPDECVEEGEVNFRAEYPGDAPRAVCPYCGHEMSAPYTAFTLFEEFDEESPW